MKFGYFGAGTWGFSLASLLASKGYKVVLWGQNSQQIKEMQKTRSHPKLPGYPADENLIFTTDFEEALTGADDGTGDRRGDNSRLVTNLGIDCRTGDSDRLIGDRDCWVSESLWYTDDCSESSLVSSSLSTRRVTFGRGNCIGS